MTRPRATPADPAAPGLAIEEFRRLGYQGAALDTDEDRAVRAVVLTATEAVT